MRRIQSKIRSCAGESIGETLIALLISALALIMLAGAISSAARIVTRNKSAMEEYYTGVNKGSCKQSTVYNMWKGKAYTNLP